MDDRKAPECLWRLFPTGGATGVFVRRSGEENVSSLVLPAEGVGRLENSFHLTMCLKTKIWLALGQTQLY